MLTIIVPAHNEEKLIGACFDSMIASEGVSGIVEVILAANGCDDGTVGIAEGYKSRFRDKGWGLRILDLPDGGKLGALNAADKAAQGDIRVYIDADVTVSPPLIAGLARTLRREESAYASGRVQVTGPGGWVSRTYARLWSKVPFMTSGVPGCGVFAMNAAGRARWDAWPDIISDDSYARMMFAPEERHLVDAPYDWPVAGSFGALVRVRRRQNTGVTELDERFPQLAKNDGTPGLGAGGYAGLALRDPVGFSVYCAVAVMVKLKGEDRNWSRGR